MPAGYSKKSLIEKLGIREGLKIFILNPPEDFNNNLGKLPKGVFVAKTLKGPLNFIHFFARKREELESKFPILKQELSQNGVLWISWQKELSKMETDLNENIVREIGLKNGMVDVKICAVDKIWSGLKFVFRLKER